MLSARACFLLAGLAAGLARAEPGELQTGRYTVLAPVPTAAQSDPLLGLVRLDFVQSRAAMIGDAIRLVLANSGYRLAAPSASDPGLPELLAQPLPAAQQQLGPLAVERALTTLAGPAWRLAVDRLHRRVSFEVAPAYALYRSTSIPSAGLPRPARHPATARLPLTGCGGLAVPAGLRRDALALLEEAAQYSTAARPQLQILQAAPGGTP